MEGVEIYVNIKIYFCPKEHVIHVDFYMAPKVNNKVKWCWTRLDG